MPYKNLCRVDILEIFSFCVRMDKQDLCKDPRGCEQFSVAAKLGYEAQLPIFLSEWSYDSVYIRIN